MTTPSRFFLEGSTRANPKRDPSMRHHLSVEGEPDGRRLVRMRELGKPPQSDMLQQLESVMSEEVLAALQVPR